MIPERFLSGDVIMERYQKNRVSLLYRAATTKYPCFDQDLGDSSGAGRIGLTLMQRYVFLSKFQNEIPLISYH
jgi:hypothetical protein